MINTCLMIRQKSQGMLPLFLPKQKSSHISSDETHQFILAEGTALTIYNDGTVKNNQNRNICPAFTVEDIDKEYEKVLALGAGIIEGPAKRPRGAINMSFYDSDDNVIFFRSFPKDG